MHRLLRKYWLQTLLGLLILIAFSAHVAGAWRLPIVARLDAFFYDTRLVHTMSNTHDARVVIVDIDEKSLASVGHWPWRRDVVARLVDQLIDKYKAAAVGFDIVFAERDESSGLPILQRLAQNELRDDGAFQAQLARLAPSLDYDAQLARSLRNRPVVLGYYFNQDLRGNQIGRLPLPALPAGAFKDQPVYFRPATGYGANLPELTASASGAGYFNPAPDEDGVTRRMVMLTEFAGNYYETLSLAMVRAYLGAPRIEPIYATSWSKSISPLEYLKVGPVQIPVDDAIKAMVPYRGAQKSFTYLSAADVLNGQVPPDVLAGRMVLIGTTAPGLNDLRVTPPDPDYPGVEIHANLVAGMLTGTLPAQPDYLRSAELLQLLVCWLLMSWILLKASPIRASISTAGLALLVIAGNFALWHYQYLAMPLASTLLTIGSLYAISMSYGYFFEFRRKKQMASLFGQYVPPELVAKMSEEPRKYSMHGQSRELTVLFSDVRNFTTIAEMMAPGELTRFMNEFLTPLSEVIRNRYFGTIDKYMGDCVMAFWGAPIYDPNHARLAVLAGLEMQQRIAALGPQFRQRNWPEIKIGVGVNTGRMVVGDMGSQIRKAYTVMGDAVNLASRLESYSKHYGVGMIVGETTRQAVGDAVLFRELDRIRVKGKNEPVTIYEPICKAEDASEGQVLQVAQFHEMLAGYRARDWDAAEAALNKLGNQQDGCLLYQIYSERIAQWRKNSPGANWDGVYDFDTK